MHIIQQICEAIPKPCSCQINQKEWCVHPAGEWVHAGRHSGNHSSEWPYTHISGWSSLVGPSDSFKQWHDKMDREAWTNGAEDALYVRHLGWSHIWVCVYQPRVNVGWDWQAVCHREATWFLKSLDPSHFYTTGLKHNDANNYSEVMLLRNVNVNVITGQWQVGEMDATIKKN